MTATVSPERTGPDRRTAPPSTAGAVTACSPALVRAAAFTILAALVAVFVFLAIEGWSGLTAAAGDVRAVHVLRQLHRAAGRQHPARLGDRGDRGGAVRDRDRAVHLALRAAAAGRRCSAYLIDLLAAVPSVVFGLWGGRYLAAYLQPLHVWLHDHLGFLPVLRARTADAERALAVHRRHRAGDHDPADHHRDLP